MSLKELRNKKNLKAADVAKVLGISESAYRKYEASLRVPRATNLNALQEALGCTDAELLEAIKFHADEWEKK